MRSRLKWAFAGITALVLGYTLFKRQQTKKAADDVRRFLERDEKLKAIAEAMKREREEDVVVPFLRPDELPPSPTRQV